MQKVAETRLPGDQEEPPLQPDRLVWNSVFSNPGVGHCSK